jgi:flagellar basal body-associated protein FliL
MENTILTNNKKTWIFIIVVIAMVALGVAAYFIFDLNLKKKDNNFQNTSTPTVEDFFKDINPLSNPLEKSPDLNPVEKTNPFNNIKINPFK